MDKTAEKEHAEHLKFSQDHYKWRSQHMQALAVLKRIEARILDQESRIIAHEAEIAAHEEFFAHGPGHASAPVTSEHAALSKEHKSSAENNSELIKAVLALKRYVD
jgi:hypothetical protein